MKLITRNTDYAIRALCYIARQEKKEIVSVTRLNKVLKIPRPFLRKILQILNQSGLIHSYKGMGGGFSLAKAPKNISLTALMQIFQGPLQLNECFFKKSICPHMKSCILRSKITAIERYVLKELKTITIATLLEEKRA